MQLRTKERWLEDLLILPPERRVRPIPQVLEDDLLVSAPSKHGMPGGLFHLKKSSWLASAEIITLDTMDTSGLWLQQNLFLRSVQNATIMIIVAYSETGQVWTIINSELKNIHDIRMFNDELYVVSCGTNEIVRVSMRGDIEERWKFGNGGHTWHINSISEWEGRLVASCGGRFEKEPDWTSDFGLTGQVFDVKTGEVLWEKLSRPHTPAVDPQKRKYICDSRNQRVLLKELDGKIRELKFPGTFPKALAWGKNMLYVGLAKFRQELEGVKGIDSARIAILDQKSLTVLDYISLPCSEMYNIATLPEDKNGFLKR